MLPLVPIPLFSRIGILSELVALPFIVQVGKVMTRGLRFGQDQDLFGSLREAQVSVTAYSISRSPNSPVSGAPEERSPACSFCWH